MTRTPELVLFDLDGTLTDSAEGIVASFRHALQRVGAEVPDGDLAGRIVGPPMHHTLSSMGLGARADEAITAYRADYTTRGWSMNTSSTASPICWPTCRRPGSGWRWPRRRREPTAQRILAHFGLDGHFEVIAGASTDGSRAAKADVVAHALAQLEPLPERVVMVGDRSHDVEGAAEHGIDTVVVGWGSRRRLRRARRAHCAAPRRDGRRAPRGALCLRPCTSRSSVRATSAARRWPRRCSPTRSASAAWPTWCG